MLPRTLLAGQAKKCSESKTFQTGSRTGSTMIATGLRTFRIESRIDSIMMLTVLRIFLMMLLVRLPDNSHASKLELMTIQVGLAERPAELKGLMTEWIMPMIRAGMMRDMTTVVMTTDVDACMFLLKVKAASMR
jgi:hypothetical protein